MPDFSVHIDPESLDLAAIRSPRADKAADRPAVAAHHGARDGRQAALQRSGKDRSRAAGASRSYAFRRS